jgi:RNA polymerase sigma factor (sigma-70 family)
MERPAAYARRILVNRALSGHDRRLRRRRELAAATPPEPAEPGTEPGTEPGEIGEHDELMSALAALPPRQRAVIVLRYFLDLPEAEVAAALKCSLGTVKSTASRALARLELALRTTNDTRSIPT